MEKQAKDLWHNEYGVGNEARCEAVTLVIVFGYTPRQVAQQMHVDKRTVYGWLKAAGYPMSQRRGATDNLRG